MGSSLTVSYTRANVLRETVDAARTDGICGANFTLDTNYLATGNVALLIGQKQRKPIWSMAHLDNISFLTGTYKNGCYPLTPFCEAR